jgi:site-specific recombinase XerD
VRNALAKGIRKSGIKKRIKMHTLRHYAESLIMPS